MSQIFDALQQAQSKTAKHGSDPIVAEKRGYTKMKNIYDVMQQKELEIERLKKEIEALRIVAPMLGDKETAPEILREN